MFKRVVVANRGEIAVRIIRSLREMNITSVALFSEADRDALFVQEADEAYFLGPAPAADSYLNIDAVVALAVRARADALHPGYGFLAENASFADAVIGAGIMFIGPSAFSMRTMGDKVRARQAVAALGVPVVPGTAGAVTSLEQAEEFGREHGFPLAVKASGGGGGRGIRVVHRFEELASALETAQREAQAYFKNSAVYLERYYQNPRHIEVQVIGDHHGSLVHLGERDCSVQRRHQKLIEESPSPAVSASLRQRMGDVALRAAEAAKYFSAGTVEFLLADNGEFYFLEMNTRIQVEHPVTELVSDVDLIREMVLVASGEPLTVHSNLDRPRGHAIEVRVNAEDPSENFRPTPATITRYREPGGIGVRVDSGVYEGYTVPQSYDSLLAKVIVWGHDREAARRRALRALREYAIDGPRTTIPFAEAVLNHPDYVDGGVCTTFVESHIDGLLGAARPEAASQYPGMGEMSARGPLRRFEVEVNRKLFHVQVAEVVPTASNSKDRPRRSSRSDGRAVSAAGPDLVSPMHGTIIAINKKVGDPVIEGESLFVVEAMKMENEIHAHRSGTLSQVYVSVGHTVEARQKLAHID
ncbi:MAG: acetyl-CoA carboxylase biotin carboxylase subunit [Chloroflexota bacterium]